MNKKHIAELVAELKCGTEIPTSLIPKTHIWVRRKANDWKTFERNADWSLQQIVDMYGTALANGATIVQVDASCIDTYGITFGTMFALWVFFS